MVNYKWASLAALTLLGTAVAIQAQPKLNYDPNIPDPAPTLDAGWAYDQVENYVNSYDPTPDPTAISDSSPYVFTLTSPADFLITDAYASGDTYAVYNGATLLLETAGGGFSGDNATTGADAWADANYSHGSIELAPGSYSLSVESLNETGIIPAGFFTELNTVSTRVPDAGSVSGIAGLIWAGLFIPGALRKKRS